MRRFLSLVLIFPLICALAGLTLAQTPGDGQVELSASPSEVEPGESITVSWKGIREPASDDWIGLFRPDTAATSAIQSQSTGGSASGSATFTIPITMRRGEYEFRLFARGGYVRLAGPIRIKVGVAGAGLTVSPSRVAPGGTTTLSWSGIRAPDPADRIVLFRAGDPDTAPQNSSWSTNGAASGSVAVTTNWTPGDYVFRLFQAGRSSSSASSNTLTVAPDGAAGPASVTVSPDSVILGDRVKVSWTGVGSTASDKQMLLRVYRVGERSTGRPVWQSDTPHRPEGSFELSIGLIGTFELILAQETVGELTSNQFTVRGVNGTRIEVTPANPTVSDEISLRIFGDWPNTCVPSNPTTLSAGFPFGGDNAILIRFADTDRGARCDPVITPWSSTVSLGRRGVGRYAVGVLHGLRLIASTEIVVHPRRGPANIEVTPANPTTDKAVIVRVFGQWPNSCAPGNPTTVWDDAARTLTVKYPGYDGACADVITPWSHSFQREGLAAGTWQVKVLYGMESIGGGSFTVTPPPSGGPSLTVSPTEVTRLQAVTVTWSNVPPGEHRISLGGEAEDSDFGIGWNTGGQPSGSFEFATSDTGTFVFRLHPAGQREKVLASARFTVK